MTDQEEKLKELDAFFKTRDPEYDGMFGQPYYFGIIDIMMLMMRVIQHLEKRITEKDKE